MKIKDKNLYFVGGVVRDEILGTTSFDTDYCYEGNAIEFAKDFNIIKTNPDFGTVRILHNDEEIDIASTRTESYPKAGHLPVVDKIACPLAEDLKRRDFTINALAKNTISGEIVDFYGGLTDIQNKTLRVLHDSSFIDDPSRIIRGLKFSVRFGFELDEHTLELQNKYLNNINYDMSFHRIKKELIETFNLNSYKAYQKFLSQGIYKLFGDSEPFFKLNRIVENLITKYKPNNIWVIYASAFNLSNLALTTEEQNIIDSLIKIKSATLTEEYDIYKLFKDIPLESIIIYASSVNYDIAKIYLEKLANIFIETKGDDLLKIGIPQGKLYSEIFDFLMKEKIKNPNLNKYEELELVKKEFYDKKTL